MEKSSGMSLSSTLLVIFVVLKLTRVIDWSWWWVLSPLWIILSVIVITTVILAIIKYTKE